LQYASFVIVDSGAIFNKKLDRGETADLILILRNAGSPIEQFTGRLRSSNQFLQILDNEGQFEAAGAGETTCSSNDYFRVRADVDAPIEIPINCELIITNSQYQDTILIPIIVGDSMNLPVGPDDYGYAIYDWTDSCYLVVPDFEWKEIRGIGERVEIGDDETVWYELPSAFGYWRYYGIPYRFISISSNGWIAADTTSRCDFTNVQLPYTNAPPNIVAFLWDDLAPTRYGDIWYYFDTADSRIIVEFDSISYFGAPDKWEMVQVQIYDTSYLGANRDNPIGIYFLTVNDFKSVTVGIQNRNGTSGLTYFWNGNYPRSAAFLLPRRALWIQSDAINRIAENQVPSGFLPRSGSSIVNLHKYPLRIGSIPDRVYTVEIYQADGRLVRRIPVSSSCGKEIYWDGSDYYHRKLNRGVYYLRMKYADRVFCQKIVLIE